MDNTDIVPHCLSPVASMKKISIPGYTALAKIHAARHEIRKSSGRKTTGSVPAPVDTIAVEDIPSVAALGMDDRVLANIDQDGFKFAVHPLDVPLFNEREAKVPRLRYQLDIVLFSGKVCIRKKFVGYPPRAGLKYKLYSWMGLNFYTEAAVLKRLEGLACVPRIHDIAVGERTLVMDYIHGKTIQHFLSERTDKLLDIDLPDKDKIDDPEREQREIDAFMRQGKDPFQEKIRKVADDIFQRGVCPLDIKSGNLIAGHKTGRLYWIDFERASLNTFPTYARDVVVYHSLLSKWFGIASRPEPKDVKKERSPIVREVGE